MKVTSKGRVTIPLHIRRRLELTPGSDVEFVEEGGRVYLVKRTHVGMTTSFSRWRGRATVKMTTDQIMALMRGDD